MFFFFCLSSYSESPFSEHGALEEVENEGGTEAHTSEDGEWQHKKNTIYKKKKKTRHGNILISFEYRKFKSILNKCKHQMYFPHILENAVLCYTYALSRFNPVM